MNFLYYCLFKNKDVTGSPTVCEMPVFFKDCCNAIYDISAMQLFVIWSGSYSIYCHHCFLIFFDIKTQVAFIKLWLILFFKG
jgi:hypothetical protein